MADFRASSGAIFAWRRGTAPVTPATVWRDNRWLLYVGGLGSARVWQAFGATTSSTPTITAVDPVSGTELQVTWTGTASRYRLDGGTPVTLTDTVSPATISGLSPNQLYAVELDNGDGNWSNSVSEWTDNTGGGGGGLAEGSLTSTLGAATLSAAGSLPIAGAVSQTLAAATLAATGALLIVGTTTQTLAAATLAATGELVPLAGTGVLAQTLADATLTAAGALSLAATLTATLEGLSCAATSAMPIAGTLAQTLDDATLTATGELVAPGTGSVTATLGDLTCAATGRAAIAGALNVPLGDLVLSGSATLALRAELSATLGALSLSAAGAEPSGFVYVTNRAYVVIEQARDLAIEAQTRTVYVTAQGRTSTTT